MCRPAADKVAHLIGKFVQTYHYLYLDRICLGKRDDASNTHKVWEDKITKMQNMALEIFRMQSQLPKFYISFRNIDPKGRLCRLERGQCVSNRADSANTRGYVVQDIPFLSHHHRFKETRGFRHLPFALFKPTVLYVDDNISVSFNSGNVVNVYIMILMHNFPIQNTA